MGAAKRYGAEFLGTLFLVFVGVGSAVAGRSDGIVVVALAFGLVLLALMYTLGPVSGCHINPAVTLAMLATGRIALPDAVGYWVAQFAGATVGALGLWGLTHIGDVTDETGALGTNAYGAHINFTGTILLEIVLTFLFVLVVLVVTARTDNAGVAGLAIGLALAACHLIAVPLDGTSVNPARSFGPAIFEGGTALSQLWVFIVAPLLGALLAVAALPLIREGARDRATGREPASTPAMARRRQA